MMLGLFNYTIVTLVVLLLIAPTFYRLTDLLILNL
jgi:hypothetical protein